MKKKGEWSNGTRVKWLDEEPNVLLAGKSLPQGSVLPSKNNQFVLKFDYEGQILVNNKDTDECLWQAQISNTQIQPPFILKFKQNGELKAEDLSGQAYFSTNTADGGQPPYKLVLGDDGTLVINDSQGQIWSSADSQNQNQNQNQDPNQNNNNNDPNQGNPNDF